MPYPRRISGGALDIGAAQFSHLVRNLDTNSGLCLLIFKVVCQSQSKKGASRGVKLVH